MRGWLDRIFCMDCVEGMDRYIPRGSVDVAVTSPPYNTDVKYDNYEDDVPFDEYLELISDVAGGVLRVLRDDGSFFFNVGERPSDEFKAFRIAETVARAGFRVQNTVHWIKSVAIPEHDVNVGHFKPVNSRRFLNSCHEYIFHFTRGGDVPLDKLSIGVPYQDKSNVTRWKSPGGVDRRDRGNVWFIPYDTVVASKKHPATFPLGLPEMCIKLHGIPEDRKLIVMDPLAGMGTVAVAARDLGCHYVLFEVSKVYCLLAREWLETGIMPKSSRG